MSFTPAPFYPYWVRPLARTPGVYNEVLQPKFELPLSDASGPTDINNRNLSYFQGAVNEGPLVQVIAGTQGVINLDQFTLNGLLEPATSTNQAGIE